MRLVKLLNIIIIIRACKVRSYDTPDLLNLLQDSGEYVLVTAGEVHLQRCVDDLQHR